MPNSVFLSDGVPFSGQMVGPAADNTAAPPFSFLGDLTSGYASSAVGTLDLVTAGTSRLRANSTAVFVNTLGLDIANQDVLLVRDAANTLALKNGTNAQGFRVYGDATNYVQITQTNGANLYQVVGGGGTISFQANSTIGFAPGDSTAWRFLSTGHLVAATDNTYDIGASGATRPRTAYFGTSAYVQGANAQSVGLLQLTEVTTIAAAGTTTTTIQMPAGAIVIAVNVRVTTVIPTATSFSVGDSGSATRFSTANVSTAATSTDPGTKAGAYYNASATGILLTMNGGTPADNTGRVRVTIYYFLSTPPTS